MRSETESSTVQEGLPLRSLGGDSPVMSSETIYKLTGFVDRMPPPHTPQQNGVVPPEKKS
ncbi:hypothetical protein KI387_025664, partial [Taxus chinensis]